MSSFPYDLPLKRSGIPGNLESRPPGGDGRFHYSTSKQYSVVSNLGQYANCPQSVCLYTVSGGDQCSQIISCGTAPEHFRVVHESQNITSSPLYCGWQGCGDPVLQRYFIRHIRERHLKHHRHLGHANTDHVKEAQRTRESPGKVPDSGRKKSDEVRDESGKKQEDAQPCNDIVHAEGSKPEWVILPPIGEVEEGIEDPGKEGDTLQIEGSDSGSHTRTESQQGQVGGERESGSAQRFCPYRKKQA